MLGKSLKTYRWCVGNYLRLLKSEMNILRRCIRISRAIFGGFSGASMMSIWAGLENGIPTAESNPGELAPTNQQQLQWPRWGQFFENQGRAGEPTDVAQAQRLLDLYQAWVNSVSVENKTEIWKEMLEIHADQMFTIGLVAGVSQLVVASNRLRNVPETAIYNWEPGAMFGVHRPDTFWFASP